MIRSVISFFIFTFLSINTFAQVPKDLARSVPLWLETDSISGESFIKWLPDVNATKYEVFEIKFEPFVFTTPIGETAGSVDSFSLGKLEKGMTNNYFVRKSSNGTGVGFIYSGIEIPAALYQGRCLITVTDTLQKELFPEIEQYIEDLIVDGWDVSIQVITDTMNVPDVKNMVVDWYDPDYELSQTLFILGHVPVPYSGNTAYDGHTNHYGAWAADTYYADVDGNWTDQLVNETSPSRPENDNIPGDGKFDQSSIPGDVEIEVGRVDFFNLPAFTEGEIELTRQYLVKNHLFKTGQRELPRRAIVENNFASFDEAFGQSAWRNFPTFFKGQNVSTGNYDTQLDTSGYLCSYACGGGSYTSCGGIGTTSGIWVAKDIQTVFTMVFGSYFGDWDSQNNFLRSALASGDILTNAWSGRPIWQLWHMGLGMHIGFSTKFTMNANASAFNSGYGAHSTHIGLLGDPTLRLFYPRPVASIKTSFNEGNIEVEWDQIEGETNSMLYRKYEGSDWEEIPGILADNYYTDSCAMPGEYIFMVKSIRLEETGSGSFYNTSLGITDTIMVEENNWISEYYLDSDNDGFGDAAIIFTACNQPAGYVSNDLDCDDSDAAINPDATDIPDNGIDEDCDGNDLVGTDHLVNTEINFFPNPVKDLLLTKNTALFGMHYVLINNTGKTVKKGTVRSVIDLSTMPEGIFLMSVMAQNGKLLATERIIIFRDNR